MTTSSGRHTSQRIVAILACVFGVVTLFAAGRVLSGIDPGYVVYRPLLLYNAGMGVAYVAAGILVWRSIGVGKYAAGIIFVLNLLVFLAVVLIHRDGGAVATESLRAMAFRTLAWLLLFVAAWRLGSHAKAASQDD